MIVDIRRPMWIEIFLRHFSFLYLGTSLQKLFWVWLLQPILVPSSHYGPYSLGQHGLTAKNNIEFLNSFLEWFFVLLLVVGNVPQYYFSLFSQIKFPQAYLDPTENFNPISRIISTKETKLAATKIQ
jgi:hypothetical protein